MPALFSVAAAVALSAAVTASPVLASTAAHHAAPVVHQPRFSSTQLLSAIRPTTVRKSAVSLPTRYTVKQGDSLSVIARHFYRNPDAWPVLYWANHAKVRWADSIDVGQVLNIPVRPARIPAAPGQLGPSPAPATAASTAASTAQASTAQASTGQPAAAGYAAPAQASGTYTGSGSFQQCVIARESGGNSQVMNSSGHYGLYQFSASTWAAYGGNPAAFGNASTAEQNQVFNNAIAAGGQSNWSAYDGC